MSLLSDAKAGLCILSPVFKGDRLVAVDVEYDDRPVRRLLGGAATGLWARYCDWVEANVPGLRREDIPVIRGEAVAAADELWGDVAPWPTPVPAPERIAAPPVKAPAPAVKVQEPPGSWFGGFGLWLRELISGTVDYSTSY